MRRHRWGHALLLGAVAFVAGCGRPAGSGPSQVAARVNSDEITVSQINYVLAHAPAAAQDSSRLQREVLDRLVDQALADQAAVKKALDRSPGVLQAIEFAKRQILARAYLSQVVAAVPRPSDAEVKRYYAEHPDLFAQRRIYHLEEIIAAPKQQLASALRQETAQARSLQGVAQWLKGHGVAYLTRRGWRAAEAVPLHLLPRLQVMKDGDTRVFALEDGRLDVLHLLASKPAPVDEASAAPRIRQFLFNRRSSAAIARAMKRLRAQAKIVYLGQFSGAARNGALERRSPEAASDPQGGAVPPAKVPAPGLEKGVQGLLK